MKVIERADGKKTFIVGTSFSVLAIAAYLLGAKDLCLYALLYIVNYNCISMTLRDSNRKIQKINEESKDASVAVSKSIQLIKQQKYYN